MSEFTLNISPEATEKIAEIIQKIATGGSARAEPEPITSFEMAEIFRCTHTRIFNRISRFVTVEATDQEKEEFEIAQREYRAGRKHPVWKLSEKGCKLYVNRMCSEERRSKTFMTGLEKFNSEIERRYHGRSEGVQKTILMNGRSRAECGYIKELFDKFVTGPAIENREIEELGEKYEEFYKAMNRANIPSSEKSKLEDAVMGAAVEAEMQGFIYKSQKSPGKQALPDHPTYALVQIWYAIPIKRPE